MLGAITGDIIGSIYEWNNIKTKDFPLFGEKCAFTDDTVCTIAVADWLTRGAGDGFADILGGWACRYPTRGYGGMFKEWVQSWDRQPYNSWGNGSAMRVSPVAHIARDEPEVLELAKQASVVTHKDQEKAIIGAMIKAAGSDKAEAFVRSLRR